MGLFGPVHVDFHMEMLEKTTRCGKVWHGISEGAGCFDGEVGQCARHLWGGQSWPQPAFSRLGRAGKRVRERDPPPHPLARTLFPASTRYRVSVSLRAARLYRLHREHSLLLHFLRHPSDAAGIALDVLQIVLRSYSP